MVSDSHGLAVSASQPSVVGEPSGPPVLLIHGFASRGSADWAGWPQWLAEAGRSALLVDLPGHGDSPAPAAVSEVVTSTIVDELAAVARETGFAEVDVVAYSLGARLAWDLAARGVVRRLVLGGISPGEPFSMVNIGQLHAFVNDGIAPSDPFTGMMSQMISSPGANPAALALLIEGLAAEPFLPGPANAPQVPTLFIAGEGDQMSQGIDGLASLVGGAEVVSVPGDHHTALRSVEFREAALAFVS